MNKEQKVEYLQSHQKIDAEVDRLLDEASSLWSKCTKCTPVMSDMPKAGGVSDRTDIYIKYIEVMDELREAINKKIDDYVDKKAEIEATIDTLHDLRHRTVLKYLYINRKTIEDTADLMYYSVSQVKRYHQTALELLNI